MYIEQLFIDLKEVNDDISVTGDPSLILEYEEEKKVLFDELEDRAKDALYLLEAYIDDCKEQNLPVVLEYYKVFRELKKAGLNEKLSTL